MFETDVIIWLQQFNSPWLLWCMKAISELGAWGYMPLILVLLFGLRMRPAMGLVLALALVGFTTDCIKASTRLPRPVDVDVQVLNKGEPGRHLLEDGRANSFWSLPSGEAIAAIRAKPEPDFGFISGHTSSALAFALALALFFQVRSRRAWILIMLWPLLTGISRMYLGRHFLADVIGGVLMGSAMVVAAYFFIRQIEATHSRANRAWFVVVTALISLAVLSFYLPWINPAGVGVIAGTLICIGVLVHIGYPDDQTRLPARFARVVVAFVIGYGVTWVSELAYEAGGWPDRHFAAFLFALTGYVAAILGTVLLSRLLGLYRPSNTMESGERTGAVSNAK